MEGEGKSTKSSLKQVPRGGLLFLFFFIERFVCVLRNQYSRDSHVANFPAAVFALYVTPAQTSLTGSVLSLLAKPSGVIAYLRAAIHLRPRI